MVDGLDEEVVDERLLLLRGRVLEQGVCRRGHAYDLVPLAAVQDLLLFLCLGHQRIHVRRSPGTES